MNKFTRFTLFAGLLAFGLAACGDDVQVVQPDPPPPPLVVSLEPASVAIDPGESVDLAVNVSGGAAAETASWTCSTSNSGVASVAGSGTGCSVTGVAPGAATVTASVTKGSQTNQAGASVVVLEDTSVPATVVIEKVTQGTLATPVALNSITRQIEVTLNIDPGTQLLEKVTLLYRGEEIASQELSPAQVAEIRAAMASDSPEEQVLRTITFSWETDRYMIDDGGGPITGTATAIAAHTNGQGPLQAVLAVNDGSSSGTAVNSAPLDLTLRNLNGFHLKLDRTGSTATALDVMGFEWRGGMDGAGVTNAGVNAHLIPVLYTPGVTLQAALFTFAPGFAAPVAVAAPAPWTYIWTPATLAGYSMPILTVPFPNQLRDGEYPRVLGNATLSDGQGMGPFGGALDCAGGVGIPGTAIGILNVEVAGALLCPSGTAWSPPSASRVADNSEVLDPLRVGERVDNASPTGQLFTLSSRPGLPDWPQVPTTGLVGDAGALVPSAGTWINENLDFSHGAIHDITTGPMVDTGVSRVVAGFPAPVFLAPTFTGSGGTLAAGTDITGDPTGMSLPETITPTVYTVTVTDADALDNRATLTLAGATGSVVLGSDWTDPVLMHTAGISNPDRDGFDLVTFGAGSGVATDDLTAALGPSYNYYVNWTDPITVGASGFTAFAANPVFRQVHQVTPGVVTAVVTGSTGSTAVDPTWSTATGITNYGRGGASQQPVSALLTAAGYYVYRAYVLDDAGNLSDDTAGAETIGSALIRRQAVVDPVQSTVFGITSPVNMVGGSTVTFSSNSSDNLDLGQSFLSLDYVTFSLAGTTYWTANTTGADAQLAGGYFTPAATFAPIQGTTGGVRHVGAENEEGVIFDSPFEDVGTLVVASALSRAVPGFIRSIEWVCSGAGTPIASCTAAPPDWVSDIAVNMVNSPAAVGWFSPPGAPVDIAYAANRPNLASFSQFDATRFDHVPSTSGNVNPYLEQVAATDALSPFPHRSVSVAPINPVSVLLNGGLGTEVSVYHLEATAGNAVLGADLQTGWAISAVTAAVSGAAVGPGTPAGGFVGGRTVTMTITARLVSAASSAVLKGVVGPGQNLFPGPLGRVDFYGLEAATGTLRYLGMQNNPVVFENNPACVTNTMLTQAEYHCWDFTNTFVVPNWAGALRV